MIANSKIITVATIKKKKRFKKKHTTDGTDECKLRANYEVIAPHVTIEFLAKIARQAVAVVIFDFRRFIFRQPTVKLESLIYFTALAPLMSYLELPQRTFRNIIFFRFRNSYTRSALYMNCTNRMMYRVNLTIFSRGNFNYRSFRRKNSMQTRETRLGVYAIFSVLWIFWRAMAQGSAF